MEEEEEPLVEPTSASVMEVEVTPPNAAAAARQSDRPISNDDDASVEIPGVDNSTKDINSTTAPNPSTSHNHRPHWQFRFPPRTHIDIDSSRGQIRISASRSVGTTTTLLGVLVLSSIVWMLLSSTASLIIAFEES